MTAPDPSAEAPDSVRVAAWQAVPGPLDVEGNLERLDAVAAEAAAQGASVLVTPEMFLTGYAIGADEVRRLALEPAALPIAEIARRHDIALLVGWPEDQDEAVYNSAAFLDRHGSMVAIHRKIHLWGDLDRAQFVPGTEAPATFPVEGRKLGALICYDVEFPEAVRHLAVQGAVAVLVPTANPQGADEVQDVLLRARAVESGVGIVYANYAGSDGQLSYNGRSTIVAPDGTIVAQASAEDEELLVADLPLGSKLGADYLRDRRAELYHP
ncbi:carbon-nitrogen hydrolase family protein [Nocardioides sp. Kera G14]|uniref:carbon-nitrogen hydrolase family protein n=1 Tax=Nocardioides sp. Kera G14 TaxID=2884264 RepID=UPI001D10A74E|nr:carbon-nitrogen hydrolase family protein [Nocardioides sp. Kera G14]UDY23486.1 carbon-nitrogen hydrolase family protein [Nocardioides sp. Kera G14]